VVLLPGTGVIYTISTGLFLGWRASIVAASGCTAGIIPHLTASILGLSAIQLKREKMWESNFTAAQDFRSAGIQRKYNRMINKHSQYMVCCLTLLFLSSLVLSPMAFARLGETIETNQARYGNPVKNIRDTISPILKAATNKTYHYQGWQIRIGYINDHAVRMFYARLPKSGETQVLKPDEIEAILKAELHGGKWKKMRAGTLFSRTNSGNSSFDHAHLRWVNTNKCLAYSTNRMNLYVEASEAIIWEQSLKNEKEVQRKENIPKF
jgi:hypothetical protein